MFAIISGVPVGLKRARVRVLRDWGLVGGDFLASGGGVAAFHRCVDGRVLRVYWRFGGERFLDVIGADGAVGIG